MTVVVIVQARMNSTRLPGKVMLTLGGKTVIARVLAACLEIKADLVVCAIPDSPFSAPLES